MMLYLDGDRMINLSEVSYNDFFKICNTLFSITNLDVKLVDPEENILLQLDSITIPASLQKTDIKYFKMEDTLLKQAFTSYYYYTNTYGLDYITAGIWRYSTYYGAIIIGPFLSTIPDDAFISNIIFKNNLPVSEHKTLIEFYKSLAVVNSSTVSSIGAVLVNLCNHPFLESELITSSSLNPTRDKGKLKDRIEKRMDIIELRYKKEKILMNAISRGDKKAIQKLLDGLSDPYLDKRLPESPIRSYKNLLIVLNTICRMAAENGGVHPIYIHHISDKFAILIERTSSLPYLNSLIKRMLEEYCALVKEYSTKKYSLIVKKAINYIKIHLDNPLSLQGISKAIHVNPSHLSRKFKKETGISIIDFINVHRIHAAKVYLQSDTINITEIAFMIGFNNVNYFSRVFKKETGMTPSQYRKKHSILEELN